jgi:DNA-binding PadR family transcriptional regulator
MVGRARPLGAADYAILGLLREQPRHGYELAEFFREGGALVSVCGMPLNVLYAQVHRLERFRLIAGSPEPAGGARLRRVLHPTPAGSGAFLAWLEQPVGRMREVRQDFLLKLYFSRRDPEHDTLRLLDAQIARCEEYLAERVRERRQTTPESFEELLGQMRVSGARATLDWMKEYRAELAIKRTPVPT